MPANTSHPEIEYAPALLEGEAERNFADLNPPLTPAQAAIEAARCLYCYDAPCIRACPTAIDVPGFIRKISTGNLRGAARLILAANILGESCGRVCPTEVLCEGACVLNREGEKPIQIGRLQRHAVDAALDGRWRLFAPGPSNGRRVAAIGAGPAALAAAAQLAQWGYAVTLYDRNPLPGGLNTYGIAAYKTRAEDSLREVRMIEELGVRIERGVEIGRDLPLTALDGFDAVLIAAGLGETGRLGLPGEELEGVMGAMEFIIPTKIRPLGELRAGRRVVIIGAGNTGIDVATAARRLGAETVSILYRRGEAELPAFDYEYQLALGDRVSFHYHTQPTRILGAGGRVTGVECVRTRLRGAGRQAALEKVAGSEFVVPADQVVSAIGQEPVTGFLAQIPGIEFDRGRIVVDAETKRTGHPRYFAAGDCVNGGREVVDAVAEGMAAARGIHAALSAVAVPAAR